MDELNDGAAPMTFTVSPDGDGGVVVAIVGELDMDTAETLALGVAAVLAERPKRLTVDLAGLSFADSSAIALWVRWAGAVGEIRLRNASPLVHRVITTMGLAERLGLG